jgi:hypothetical protein
MNRPTELCLPLLAANQKAFVISSCHPERSGRSPPQQAKSGLAGDTGSEPRSEGSLWGRNFMRTIGMLPSARPKAGALHSA